LEEADPVQPCSRAELDLDFWELGPLLAAPQNFQTSR